MSQLIIHIENFAEFQSSLNEVYFKHGFGNSMMNGFVESEIEIVNNYFNKCIFICLYSTDERCRTLAPKLLKYFNLPMMKAYLFETIKMSITRLDPSILQELVFYAKIHHENEIFDLTNVNSLLDVY